MAVVQFYRIVKTNQNEYLRSVHFIICKFYPNLKNERIVHEKMFYWNIQGWGDRMSGIGFKYSRRKNGSQLKDWYMWINVQNKW